MAIEYTRVSNKEELEEILLLQKKNLRSQLAKDEIETEGFVTISHTADLLARMHEVCPHIIAKDSGRVVGYALCMHPDFSNEIPILLSMLQQLKEILPHENSFIIMGQICIDKPYRGQGVFRGLYKAMKRSIGTSYKLIVTEVDGRNTRSLNAHLAVGFTTIKKYQSDGRDWYLIVL
ncbi:MAG: GNAT family N-acetyltransferase [Eudoraea sp.]|nr:GNAT family N-acetyltransferase [Eudoraea sp.]